MARKATRNMYTYLIYDLKNRLVCKGLLKDVASMIGADDRAVFMDSIQGSKLFGEYRVERELNSVVGNSHMTMLQDIEINGVDVVLDKSSDVFAKLVQKLSEYKDYKNFKVAIDVNDILVDASIALDEIRLILNSVSGVNITNKVLDESKKDRLIELAMKLEGNSEHSES